MIETKAFFLMEKWAFNRFIESKISNKKTLESQEVVDAIVEDENNEKNILSLDQEGNANIKIKGILFPEPTFEHWLYGGTLYPDIISALKKANENPSVKKINLLINSPGGYVDGVDNAAMAIRNSEKPIEAQIDGMGASAAYYLASQADRITAMSPDTEIGSIGVLTIQYDDTKFLDNMGFKRFIFTSTDAPKKVDDPTKEEDQQRIIARLDELHNIFVTRISEGRNLEKKYINENFGKGELLFPKKALEVGMIDSIFDASKNNNKKKGGSAGNEAKNILAATSTFKDFDIVDKAWDADAAIKRVRKFTDSEEEPKSKYKLAFFWYDEKEPENFGSYKLPFVDIVDNRMVAIRRGVFAANGAMKGARGGVDIPEKDLEKVQNHIDKYIAKIEKMDEENSSEKKQKGGKALDEKAIKDAAYEEGVKAGVESERDRITKLSNWAKHNPETKEIVEEAITSGKSESDVMPQLMAGVKNNSTKIAAVENADDVSTADDDKDKNGEEGEDGKEGEDADLEEKEEIKEKASKLAQAVVKGGNF